ncbi:G-protein coupled receptor Mth [Folsomia candida]|uniref:G-protein coupled receptor Mth n=1 Tax=Folsomia candida TaxID=158441 RepID=A0A226D4N9_FOLCA|nr:G-protein coupled receptor Mth [Folsomia candida]
MTVTATFSWTVFLFVLILTSSLITISTSQNSPTLINPNLRLNKCLYNELGKMKNIYLPSTIMGNNENATFPLQLKCATRLPHCLQPCSTEILRVRIPFPEVRPSIFNVHFTPSGFIRYGSDFFPPDEYCILGSSQESVTIEICRPECKKTHVCVPKCCSADKVLDMQSNSCQYSLQRIWEPLVHKTEDLQLCGEKRANIRFHYYQAPPSCQTQAFFLKFRLLVDGSVVLRELLASEWKRPQPGQFCLDGVQNLDTVGPYSGDPLDQVLLICADDEEEIVLGKNNATAFSNNKKAITGILYSILLFLGTPFLLVTVIVYILLWGKQNVHGWTLFSHTLAMLLFYLLQGITNAVSRLYDSDDNASTSCMLIGIANHYFALASFCWMTMINYDLWSMFRYLQNTVGRSRGMKRFVVYMIIGWGVPFIAVLICVVLDLEFGLYGDDGAECATEIVVPLYGHKSCYIFEQSRPYFLFYPIGTLMAINVIFAGLTAFNIISGQRSSTAVL